MASTALNMRLVWLHGSRFQHPCHEDVLGLFDLDLDNDALALRLVAPADAREADHLLHEEIEVNRCEHQLRFALAIEFAHASDSVGYIEDGLADGLEVITARGLRLGSLSRSDSV